MDDEKDIFRAIEEAWGVALPERFGELFSAPEFNEGRLCDGSVLRFHFLLEPTQILGNHRRSLDWELPGKLIPIGSGRNQLIGLDYSTPNPRVVRVTDDRVFHELFPDFNALLKGRLRLEDDLGYRSESNPLEF